MNAIAEIDQLESSQTTTEIDKAGRLVIPKKIRESLHLVAGTRVTIKRQGEDIVISAEPQARGLYMDRGTLVYDPGPAPPSNTVDWIRRDREERLNSIGRRG